MEPPLGLKVRPPMKTWLNIRLDEDGLTAEARGAEDQTDSEDGVHSVTQSVEVKLPADVKSALKTALKDAEADLRKALTRAANRHMTAVEDAIENRGVLEKAAGAAKRAFTGRAKADGTARHAKHGED